MPDFKEALTRKVGPLPVWGWGVAVGGAFLVYRVVSGGGTKTATGTTVPISGGTALDSLDNVGGSVGGAVTDAVTPPVVPDVGTARESRLAAEVVALRNQFPDVAAAWEAINGSQFPGETHAERENRLAAEAIYLRTFLGRAKATDGSTQSGARGGTTTLANGASGDTSRGDTSTGSVFPFVSTRTPAPLGAFPSQVSYLPPTFGNVPAPSFPIGIPGSFSLPRFALPAQLASGRLIPTAARDLSLEKAARRGAQAGAMVGRANAATIGKLRAFPR